MVTVTGSRLLTMCKLTINSTLSDVRQASKLLHEFCSMHSIAVETQGHLELILVEALNNIVEHAYQKKPGGRIIIELEKVDKDTVITIIDNGIAVPDTVLTKEPGFPDENKLPEGGWGLCLIQALADTISYFRYPDHNKLVLIKSTT